MTMTARVGHGGLACGEGGAREAGGSGVGAALRGGARTSVLVERAQHLANDLTDALQRLQIVLRFVVVLLQLLRLVAHCAAGAHAHSRARVQHQRPPGCGAPAPGAPRQAEAEGRGGGQRSGAWSGAHLTAACHQSPCAAETPSDSRRAPCCGGPPPVLGQGRERERAVRWARPPPPCPCRRPCCKTKRDPRASLAADSAAATEQRTRQPRDGRLVT